MAVLAVASLGLGLVPILMSSTASAAADPDQINFELEACRNDGGIVLPNGNGDFICPDNVYTNGNLGKGWSELDLVPHRVTLVNNGGTQTYTFIVAGDYKAKAGDPSIGWDFISDLTLNTAKSSPSCQAPTMGALTITPSGSGVGGADQTIYRTVTLTQQAGTTCVYDYYQRLALGAHHFNGSSLQSNLWNQHLNNQNVGQKRVQLPVNEIAPQELRKTMSATRNSDFAWNLTKGATPADLPFVDTCSTATGARSANVSITLTWTKLPGTTSGYTVTTNIYARNPASRVITVNVSDEIKSGATTIDIATSGAVDVPANTELLVLTHSIIVTPAQLPDPTNPNFNDKATATYTDKITGLAVPGQTTAVASVANGAIGNGTTTNATAVITDTESITGAGLTFSVAAPSVGSFTNGYVAGTQTTGPVNWSSGTQSATGSVTFNKTVFVNPAGTVTSGSLSDSASLAGSNGATGSASASVGITANATGTLSLTKTMPGILQGSETASFTLRVRDNTNTVVASSTFTFAAGETSKTQQVSGLPLGGYTVTEDPVAGWNEQSPQSVALGCTGALTFNNSFDPASARAQKVTNPAGLEAGWEFTLTGPGTPTGGEKVSTTGSGPVQFTTPLLEGSYTITETLKPGWNQTGTSGDCSFTVNYPADLDRLFTCTLTNTQQGTIIVRKVTNPAGGAGFMFSGDASGTIGDGQTITVSGLAPGTYESTEAPLAGWDLTSIVCSDANSSGTGSKATFRLEAGETVTCTFTNTQRGAARVVKTVGGTSPGLPPSGTQSYTFELRQGASGQSAGTTLETVTANANNGGVVAFSTSLTPGEPYQLCEVVMPGWSTTLGPPLYTVFNPSGDNSTVCTNFTVAAGETKTFSIRNVPPPGGFARTIGFWKNWSSCSGGKQLPKLDEALAAAIASGQPISIGDLIFNGTASQNCVNAVRILDKADIQSGKKMASDPAYNLAAQLLAAKLNIQVGAGACPAAIDAVNSAQVLLDAINFTGKGAYAKSMTAAQRQQADTLATTLDQYNNNTLC